MVTLHLHFIFSIGIDLYWDSFTVFGTYLERPLFDGNVSFVSLKWNTKSDFIPTAINYILKVVYQTM